MEGIIKFSSSMLLDRLLLGKKASFKGIDNAILYTGKDAFTERLSACLKGIIDGGIEIPSSEDSFPSIERISGEHIANYASSLKTDSETYNKRFSTIIKNGLNPENYKSHFEEFKEKIMNLEIQNFKDKNNQIEHNGKN